MIKRMLVLTSVAVLALAACDNAQAKDKDKGRGKDHHHHHHDHRGGDDVNVSINFRFGEPDYRVVREYYAQPRYVAHCPPGLAKKHNGCMPPGHAKRWMIGRPLPPEVIFYEVPRDLIVLLPPPPPRHRYVRVDSDILMIAIGTGLVIDGIQNMGRM